MTVERQLRTQSARLGTVKNRRAALLDHMLRPPHGMSRITTITWLTTILTRTAPPRHHTRRFGKSPSRGPASRLIPVLLAKVSALYSRANFVSGTPLRTFHFHVEGTWPPHPKAKTPAGVQMGRRLLQCPKNAVVPQFWTTSRQTACRVTKELFKPHPRPVQPIAPATPTGGSASHPRNSSPVTDSSGAITLPACQAHGCDRVRSSLAGIFA